MSTYPHWSLSFRVRPDLDAAVLSVLKAVATDQSPGQEELASLHPVVRHYLSDWHRLLTDEQAPFFGPPLRLSQSNSSSPDLLMSIEFCQHDDEYANGGYIFWLWVLRLVARPDSPRFREVIGCRGLCRNDYDTKLVVVDDTGFLDGDVRITFEEIEAMWSQVLDGSTWDAWPG